MLEELARRDHHAEAIFFRWEQAKHGNSRVNTLKLTVFCGAIGYPKMELPKVVLALVLLGGALPIGCVEDVRFNPSGCDVHVRGRWQVDGQNPSAETCGNIALVELAIINDTQDQFWAAPEFTLRCDAESDGNAIIVDGGAYIDTQLVTRNRCGGSGEILTDPPTNQYKSRWRGTTDLKFVVDCSPIVSTQISEVDGGMILELGTIDFQTRDGGVVCPEP